MIEKYALKNDFELKVIWQIAPEGGPAEPALAIRDYIDGMIEIKQGESEILVNQETLKEFIAVLREFQVKK